MSRAWVEDCWKDGDGAPTDRSGKGKRWRVYWYEDGPPDAQGRTRRRRSKRFNRKIDAQTFAEGLNADIRDGTYIAPEKREAPFGAVAEEWLASRVDIKPSTYRRYERELRMYVLPQWGHRKIGSITKAEIARWVADLSKGLAPARYQVRGSRPPRYEPGQMRQPLSPASIEHLHTVTSSVLGWAVETDRITRNPASGVRLPRVVPADHVYLSHTQVKALATAAEGVTGDPSDGALVYLLAYTGLRINEALALKVEDLDLAAARAQVQATWTEDRDGQRILGTPKTHERRAVPLPAFLVDELRHIIAGRAPQEHVFQAVRGGPIHDHNWRSRTFAYALHDAGLSTMGLTPHKLRHTAASAAIAAGADVKVVQQMLGHKDATETLNTYGHLWPDRLDEVSAALEKARQIELSRAVPQIHVPTMSPRAS